MASERVERHPWRVELRVTDSEERTIRTAARTAGKPVGGFLRIVALGGGPRVLPADLDRLDRLIDMREGLRSLLDRLAGQRDPGLGRLRGQVEYQIERMGAVLEAVAKEVL